MQHVFYLKTCDTCKRILQTLNLPDSFYQQDIKTETITAKQLDAMYSRAGSYESLFSRRAKLYKERGLKNKDLTEADYKALILEHYTFLKRPVIISGDTIFIGNSKQTIAKAQEYLTNV